MTASEHDEKPPAVPAVGQADGAPPLRSEALEAELAALEAMPPPVAASVPTPPRQPADPTKP